MEEKEKLHSETLRQALRAHRWKIFSAVLLLFITGVGWFLNRCIVAMDNETEEFKRALVSLRVADQQYSQNVRGAVERSIQFFELIRRDAVSSSELERQRQEMVSVLQLVSTECNTEKHASLTYTVHRQNIERMFSLPHFEPTEESQRCAGWPLAIEFMRSLDVARLARDRAHRRRIADASLEQWNQLRLQILAVDELERRASQHDEELIRVVENRGVLHKCWNCFF